MKDTARLVLGTAFRNFGERLADQQEVLVMASNIMIDVYASESAWLRAAGSGSDLQSLAARLYVASAAARVQQHARAAFFAMETPEVPGRGSIEGLMPVPAENTVALGRSLASAAVERRRYPI